MLVPVLVPVPVPVPVLVLLLLLPSLHVATAALTVFDLSAAHILFALCLDTGCRACTLTAYLQCSHAACTLDVDSSPCSGLMVPAIWPAPAPSFRFAAEQVGLHGRSRS